MTVALYPQYSDTNVPTWRYGMAVSGGTGTSVPLTGTDQRWLVRSMRLRLHPGVYEMQSITLPITYGGPTQCDQFVFMIYEGDGTSATAITLSNGLQYVDVTADAPSADTTAFYEFDLGGVSATIESGKTYWLVFAIRGVNGRTTGHPNLYRLATDGPLGDYWYSSVAQAGIPTTTTGLAYQAASSVGQTRMSLEFKTANRIVYQVSSAYAGSATKVIIPRATDADYWIKLDSAVVADGQALTCQLDCDTDGAEATRTTLVLDMGATDQVTFGGANVALAAAGAEAGDTIHLGINIRPSTGKMDLFYSNRTTGQGPINAATDFATFSHAVKATDTRGSDYTVAAPDFLDFSGTATVAILQVGWQPIIEFGDSQVTRFATVLPAAFTYPRILWLANISGGKMLEDVAGQSTAGYLRYKHTTPGQGDLCEMTGVVFAFAGYGVNDISGGADAEVKRNVLVMNWAAKAAEILADVSSRANVPLIIGLPPYSDANANTHEAKTIQHQFNIMLEGLACGCRCAYVNPWWAMVASGESENDIPGFSTEYSTDLIHYDAAKQGHVLVSHKAAAALETGIVGGWWSKRRASRQNGSLFPI